MSQAEPQSGSPVTGVNVYAARRLLNEQIDAVLLPKKGAAENVLAGVHVPVHFSQPATRTVYDEPAVIVGPTTYPRWAIGHAHALHAGMIVNIDVASRVVRVAEAGSWAKGTVGSIEWDPSRANSWMDGLITSRYEAAQVTPRGIDVFDERISPANAEIRAYRFDPRVTKAAAQAIRLGYHRYQADLEDGVVDQHSLNRAIEASRMVIADQPPEVRAGALEMIDAIDLGTGQMPASAVRAALNAVTEDIFETPSPSSAAYLVPGTAEGGQPRSVEEGEPSGPAEQHVLEVQSTGSLAEREVTVFATVTPEELLRPSSQASEPFAVELGRPVVISSSAEGFVTDDQAWVQVLLEPGKRSPTVAFRYRVTSGERFVITVTVRQAGAELGRVTLCEFSKTASVAVPLDDAPYSVDVSISVDDNGVIRLFTADGNYRGHELETKLMDDEEARVLVDRFVATAVSVADESPDEVEEGLLGLALDVKNALPGTLIHYLEQTENRNVLIDYPMKYSFPFELALLESSDGNRRLLGEVHNVTRWPSNAARSPCPRARKICRAAFISDPESLAESEDEVESHRTALRKVCPTDDYHDLKTVRESVFQVTTFGLLDFVTHMGKQQGKVGLSIVNIQPPAAF